LDADVPVTHRHRRLRQLSKLNQHHWTEPELWTERICFSGFRLLGVSVRRLGHYRCFTPSSWSLGPWSRFSGTLGLALLGTLVLALPGLGPRASSDL